MKGRAMVQWAAPAALALLVMLPRLASPQFGLLDDGLTLETGREMIGRWSGVLALIPETGRFFPAYPVRNHHFFRLHLEAERLHFIRHIFDRLFRLSGAAQARADVIGQMRDLPIGVITR